MGLIEGEVGEDAGHGGRIGSIMSLRSDLEESILFFFLNLVFIHSLISIKAQHIPRFKVVVQVVLGEMREQGVWVASRCLWDSVTDNHASAAFTNVRFKRAMPELLFFSHDIEIINLPCYSLLHAHISPSIQNLLFSTHRRACGVQS